MSPDPLDMPATPNRLYLLAQKNCLPADALDYALKFTNVTPDKRAWQRFIDRSLLSLGTALLLTGIIFFFAYNWAEMHRLAKFGVIEGGILILAVFAAWQGLNHFAGKITLLAVSTLLGVLLAVYGQVYQTGADAFSLFLTWAILITPWVILSNFAPLWLLLILLLNLSLSLFWIQVIDISYNKLFLLMFGLNGLFLVAWEIAFKMSVSWLQNLWISRLLFCVALTALIIPTGEAILDPHSTDNWTGLAVILYLLTTAIALSYYILQRRDLFPLVMVSLGIVITSTLFMGRIMSDGGVEILLFLAFFVVVQISIMGFLLLRLSKHWEN